jgi:hypothetical protein
MIVMVLSTPVMIAIMAPIMVIIAIPMVSIVASLRTRSQGRQEESESRNECERFQIHGDVHSSTQRAGKYSKCSSVPVGLVQASAQYVARLEVAPRTPIVLLPAF